MIIIDYISGEVIELPSKQKAIEFAKQRIEYHNSEFSYRHRGHHSNENAVMTINDDKVIINRGE